MIKKILAFLGVLALFSAGCSAAKPAKTAASQPPIQASWIGIQDCDHPIYLKSLFLCFKDIKSATAIISAKGSCQVQINQKTVGQLMLTPGEATGCQYQVYDITGMIRKGTNTVHALVTPFSPGENPPSDRMLLLQLNITYKNGKREIFCTDKDWLVSETGPIILADALRGESINHNIECQWTPVSYIKRSDPLSMSASDRGTVRRGEPIHGVNYIETPMHEKVIDFGKVICGWEKVVIRGAKGQEIRIRHSTSLDPAGNFPPGELGMSAFTPNQDTDHFESNHTIYRFRYICVEGLDGPLSLDDFTAIPAQAEGEFDQTTFLFSDNGLNYINSDNLDLASSFDAIKLWEKYREDGNLDVLRGRYEILKSHSIGVDPAALAAQKDGISALADYAARAKCLSNIASAIGRINDAVNWEQSFNSARELYLNEFVTPSGRLTSTDPLCYATALKWEIIPWERQSSVLMNMLANIPENYRLGDTDSDVICSVLSDNGYDTLAYSLSRGNNTAIDGWLRGYVLGVRPTSPGYKTFDVQPHIENNATHSAQGGIDTPYGRIQIFWEASQGHIERISVTVPSGTAARLMYNSQIRQLKSGTHTF